MEGTFDYYQGSDVYFAFYNGDTQVNTIPSKDSGVIFDSEKSNCTNGASIEWNRDAWEPTIKNLTQTKTKCTLYFTQWNLGNEILKNETGKESVEAAKQTIEAKGTPDFSQLATENEGMYAMEDDYGTSYYYRGAVENNYVKFAGYYWRIIRINGDGSIRLIYNGEKPDQTGSHTQIKTAAFNTSIDNPAYVGYMYGSLLNTSYEETHANEIDSNIKKELENWYQTNIYDKGYSMYIADEIFCNDRSITEGNGYITDEDISFKARQRLAQNKNPSLICPQENDKFTTSTAAVGNKKLTYPVGLITADELAIAGAVYGNNNQKFYLCTGNNYWTMSPSCFLTDSNASSVWAISDEGYFEFLAYVVGGNGIRPVISLKSDTQITGGTGTASEPYIVN